MSNFYIYGAGGHATVVAELAEFNGFESLFFYVDEPSEDIFMGYPVVNQLPAQCTCVLAIGNNKVRKNLAQKNIFNFISLTHPSSNISKRSKLGLGTVVMAGVSVNARTNIGNHCIVNTNASIDHDCRIDDFVHISPNAALAGNVQVGEGTHIGIGSSVIQGISIGRWCTIGAGAVVIRDVPDGVTVVGNPAKELKREI